MRVLIALCALLAGAAAGGRAEDGADEARGAPAQLVTQLGAEAGLRRAYHAFTAEERRDFDLAYRVYAEHVALRRGQGWLFHDDPAVNSSISERQIPLEIVAQTLYDIERKGLPQARERLEEMRASSNAVLLRDVPRQERLVDDLQRDVGRKWGRCGDWSDEISARLSDESFANLEIGHTEVVTNAVLHYLPGGQESFEHASVRVCGKSSGSCVVLDPWRTGEPAARGPQEWSGGGRVKSCLQNARGSHDEYCAPR